MSLSRISCMSRICIFGPTLDIRNFQLQLKSYTSTVPTVDTTNTYAITNTNTVSMVLDATRGYVFYFKGSNYLTITAPTNINSTKTFWVKTSTPSNGGGNVFTSGGVYPVWFGSSNYLGFHSGGTNYKDPTDEGTGWVFYAITTTSTNCAMYVNGSLTPNCGGVVTSWSGLTGNIQFGALGTGNFYTGYLDDMRLYNYTLTPSEIQSIFNTTK